MIYFLYMLFSDFTLRDWRIFFGNGAIIICSILFIPWWIQAFNTGSYAPGQFVFVVPIVIAGLIASVFLIHGTFAGIKQIVLTLLKVIGFTVSLYAVLSLLVYFAFKCKVTKPLVFMPLWFITELFALNIIFKEGGFSFTKKIIMTVSIIITFFVGILCYILCFKVPVNYKIIFGIIASCFYAINSLLFILLQIL